MEILDTLCYNSLGTRDWSFTKIAGENENGPNISFFKTSNIQTKKYIRGRVIVPFS